MLGAGLLFLKTWKRNSEQEDNKVNNDRAPLIKNNLYDALTSCVVIIYSSPLNKYSFVKVFLEHEEHVYKVYAQKSLN